MFFYKTIIIYRLKSSEFEKPILYIWNSFPSKLSAALLNLHCLFSSSRHFSMSNIWTYFSLKNILLRSPKDISCSFQFSPLFQVVFPFKFLVYSCHRKRWSAYKKVGFPWPHVTWVTRSFELFSHSQFTQPQINRPDLSVWDKPPFHKLTLPSAFTII